MYATKHVETPDTAQGTKFRYTCKCVLFVAVFPAIYLIGHFLTHGF